MNVFTSGQNAPLNIQSNQQFGAPVTNLPFPQPQNFGGGFQQLPFPQNLLQNLVQQVVSQLLYSLLNQYQNPSSNQATPFNDILRGGDDAELIQGFGGNDQLYGNGGNDILRGGEGHDYLNGGQGNDSLFGGAGNDWLRDDFGSNHLDGGDGHDTLQLNGQFSDYTFEKNFLVGTPENPAIPGSYAGFLVTNNATGELSTVESIENFQFTDGSVTADQLDRHIEASQEVTLTGDQDSAIRDRFDIGNGSTYRVLDRDASQELSVGDELEITIGGDALSTVTLTSEDVEAINNVNPLPQELSLSDQEKAKLGNYFNQGTSNFTGTVIDQDGSGTLSVGDIAKLTIGGFAGNIDVDHVITQQDLDAINSDVQALTLTGDQDSAIRERFNAGDNFRVVDKDNSSSLSVGDDLEITVGNATHIIVLTDEDVAAINGTTEPQELNLSQDQQDAIGARFNRLPPPLSADFPTTTYEGIATDADGDGELGVGDTVTLRTSGGFGLPGQTDQVTEHVLTAEDSAFMESDRSDPLLDIANGRADSQQQRVHHALYGNQPLPVLSQVESIFDTNSDGKLSVGDYVEVKSFSEVSNAESIGYIEVTQDILNAFTEGKNADVLATLQENMQKWEDSGSEQNGYSFRLDRSSFALPESVRPTISHVNPKGDLLDVFADTGRAVPEGYDQANASIDSLFAVIQNAIDSQADKITVEYDPTTGHPTSILIDHEQMIADEELSLDISNLVINPDPAAPVTGPIGTDLDPDIG